jgi:hypothetical protein
MDRLAAIESRLFSNQLTNGFRPAIHRNRAFRLTCGFDLVIRQSKLVPTFLHLQQLPSENDAPNEPIVESPRLPQYAQKTTSSDSGKLSAPTQTNPKRTHSPMPIRNHRRVHHKECGKPRNPVSASGFSPQISWCFRSANACRRPGEW